MDCSHCQEHLVSYHLGELDEQTAREVEAELQQCAVCAQALVRVQQTLSAVSELPDVAPPASIRQNVLRQARLAVDQPNAVAWWQSQGVALAASVLLVAGAGWLSFHIATGPSDSTTASNEVVAVADEAQAAPEERLPLPNETATDRVREGALSNAPAAEVAAERQTEALDEALNEPPEEGVEGAVGSGNMQANRPAAAAPERQAERAQAPARAPNRDSAASIGASASGSTGVRGRAPQADGGDLDDGLGGATRRAPQRPANRQQSQGLGDLSATTTGVSGGAQAPPPPRAAVPEPESAEQMREDVAALDNVAAAPPINAGDAERAGVATPTTVEEGRARGNIDTAPTTDGRGFGGLAANDGGPEGQPGAVDVYEEAEDMELEQEPAPRALRDEQPEMAMADEVEVQATPTRRSRRERRERDSEAGGAAPAPAPAVDRAELSSAPAEDADDGVADPSLSDGLYASGLADYDAGRTSAAASAFGRFLQESSPSDGRRGEATYLMGAAQLRSGETDAGQRTLRGFLDRYPGHRRTADAEALLRALEREQDTLRRAPGAPQNLEAPQ